MTLDGIRYGPFEFRTPGNHVTEFYAGPDGLASNIYCYLDAVGYSWDPGYEIGDNLKEGLLLSFENNTNLNWKGYSLDGASNKTISGNATIQFPTSGNHRIQVFGNDSLGNVLMSNLRYFSIDSSLPFISVYTPLQYSYFSNVAPTFQVTISGDNLNSIFYQIGDSKIFFGNNQGQINQNLWNGCDEGLVLITFYVNNTIGNYSVAEVTVYKDTILPSISTQFSYEGNSYDTPPYFFLSISDASLDLKWFTLNDDPTKHYLAGQNLGFASELWYSLYDGMITITIYATDKAGNENSYEFHVIKDVYGDYPNYPDPYIPSYYPSIIAVAIGGIMLLGIIVTIIIIFTNKNTQPRTRAMYFDQPSYRSPPIKTKQHENSPSEVKIKCPYCSYEEDIDGNFCPRCGARLR